MVRTVWTKSHLIGTFPLVVLILRTCTQSNHLRHFVAVDHENEKVVLAIRGTFSLSEMVVNIAGFSRECIRLLVLCADCQYQVAHSVVFIVGPFCNGEAHSEMAKAAEHVWEVAGATVLRMLEENPGYELIITGHSLGSAVASLLNIFLYQNEREIVGGRRVRSVLLLLVLPSLVHSRKLLMLFSLVQIIFTREM